MCTYYANAPEGHILFLPRFVKTQPPLLSSSSSLPPFYRLAMLVLELPLAHGARAAAVVRLPDVIRRPYPLDAELERAGHSVRQAQADGPHLLAQQLRLRLDDVAVVGAHEVVPLGDDSLQLARPIEEEPVLVQVAGDDRLGLDVDEVAAPVRLDAQRQEHVRVDVEQAAPEDGGAAVQRPPRRVACALDLGPVLGELGRDAAVEAGVAALGRRRRRRRRPRCGGHPVEVGRGKAAHVCVRHGLALGDGFGVAEGSQFVRPGGTFHAFEPQSFWSRPAWSATVPAWVAS